MNPCQAVERALSEHGVLLLQDKSVRSVVGIITGERLSTSWWNHVKGREIFACLGKLGDDPDVLISRLIAGKVTYVHRKLWPAFLALACSNEPWQTSGLSESARDLLRSVIATSPIRAKGPGRARAARASARSGGGGSHRGGASRDSSAAVVRVEKGTQRGSFARRGRCTHRDRKRSCGDRWEGDIAAMAPMDNLNYYLRESSSDAKISYRTGESPVGLRAKPALGGCPT